MSGRSPYLARARDVDKLEVDKLEETPFLSLLITPKGFKPTMEDATLLRILGFEGKCGVEQHVVANELSKLAAPETSPLLSALRARGVALNFDAEKIAEVQPPSSPAYVPAAAAAGHGAHAEPCAERGLPAVGGAGSRQRIDRR